MKKYLFLMNENPSIPVRYPDTLLACIQQLYRRGIQMKNPSLSTSYINPAVSHF